MAQRSVPIPGEILKTTVIFGLTFNEIIVLAAMPLVLVLPSAMLDFIPLWVSLATVAVGAVGVLIVVAKTPEGQSPVQWFPAYINRWINPEKYVIKPRDQTKYGAPDVKYLDVVHTAPLVKAEEELSGDEFDFEEFKDSIEHAEKLDTGVSVATPQTEREEREIEQTDEDGSGILSRFA